MENKTIEEYEAGKIDGKTIGMLQERKRVIKLIDERIENYRTIYGVKKETVIQSAFIYELENLKRKLEDSH